MSLDIAEINNRHTGANPTSPNETVNAINNYRTLQPQQSPLAGA